MKTKLLFIAVAAIGMSSCSLTDDLKEAQNKQNSINFANGRVIGSTKAIDKTTTWAGNEEVGIFATKTSGAIATADFNANFASNLKLTNSIAGLNGSWTPASALYWPINDIDRITFFAYHPYADGINAKVPEITSGAISITHTVKKDPAEQTDLLWAWVKEAHKDDMNGVADGTSSSVPFAFNHALTKISFSGSTNIPSADGTVQITALSMTVNSINTSETDVDGSLSWGTANTPVTFPIVASGDLGTFTIQASGPIENFTSDDHELLMVPQLHLNSGNKINLSFTITNNLGTPTIESVEYILADTNTGKWAQNKHVRYNFNLVSGKIEFTTSIVGWDDETGGTFE